MARLPRLGRVVWLAYAALLGVAQASLAFAWAVHTHGGCSGASGRASSRQHHHQQQGQGHGPPRVQGALGGSGSGSTGVTLRPTPSQQQQQRRLTTMMVAGPPGSSGSGSGTGSRDYCQRCRLSTATATSSPSFPQQAAAPPPSPPSPSLQHARTVRVCAAVIRGARGGGWRARSKAPPAAGEQLLTAATAAAATKSRGRGSAKGSSTALKASSSSGYEQPSQQPQPPPQRGRRGGGDKSDNDKAGEGALLLPERPKQELSSTVGILAAGMAVTGLAAVLPTSLQAGAPTLLAALLAALKPAPDVVLTGAALYWRIFLAGGVCASISHGWAVPLDVVKTRLQTDPERYKGLGIWGAFAKIRQEEGPGMLLKGLGATLAGYSIQGSLKYGLYAMFKAIVKGWLPTASIFVTFALASVIADFIASTALCPLEATRIRLVADPTFASGTVEGISRLVEQEGALSIFKGMPAILAKQLPYTIVQLCGFEMITWLFYSWETTAAFLASHSGGMGQWLVSFGSAMITAVFASLASQPGDVILSRVNKDRSDKPVLATMTDTVKDLGLKGLFKGTRARLLHVGIIVTIQLVIYDFVKQLVGLPATGAH